MEAAAETINASSVPRGAFWLKALSDKSLVKLLAGGSDEAFTVIYQRYQGPLFAYCVSILQDYSEAEDALHEIMIRTHGALKESERDIEIKPWLFRCARNHCLNVIQRRSVRDGAMQELIEEQERVDSKVEMKEEVREVLQDVSHLPDEQRQALLMREAAGLSHVAIADALDVDAAKAKRLLFEARRSLHAGAEGRNMECAEVRYEISQGDGRTGRRKNLRSHLRSCDGCVEFQKSTKSRKAVLAGGLPLLGPGAAFAALAKIFGSASTAEAATAAAGSAGAASATGAGATGIAAKLAGTGLIAQKGIAIVAAGGIIAGGGYAVTEEVRDIAIPDKGTLSAKTPGGTSATVGINWDTKENGGIYSEHTSTKSTSNNGGGNGGGSEAGLTVVPSEAGNDFEEELVGTPKKRTAKKSRKGSSKKRSGSRKGKKKKPKKKPVKKQPGEGGQNPPESNPEETPPAGQEPPPPVVQDPPPGEGSGDANPDKCQQQPMPPECDPGSDPQGHP